MYEMDVKAFWEENSKCFEPFSTNKPRVPMNFWLDDHFLLEYMKLPSTLKYYNDAAYRREVNTRFNDEMERLLGRRFINEEIYPEKDPVRFECIMGAHWELSEGGTPWLETDVKDIEDVKALIYKYKKLDMKKAAFPEGWQESREQYEKTTGKKLRLGGGGSRGPATMATSILGTENTCIFIMEEPEIMDEFFAYLAHKLIEYHNVLMEATDNTDNRNGYNIADDNCYLFPPKHYERFCAPVLEKLFKEFSPKPCHKRRQHSDSDMGHLMGILNDLGVNTVNFGPNIHPGDIRKAMPKAVIEGQMPPFTLRNSGPDEIINIVKRDIEAVGGDGGLVECTAGSVAGGTPIENILVYMWAVEQYGRY
ncbi:MAG: methylcobalamin:coenzyme M methyltransferase [Firmicutes bacterium ADurb.Bin193]|nr:MAG: methylcobalamin:coenzyme M methyltransferase [Firmicutes bacterium ADurb.Bin193]